MSYLNLSNKNASRLNINDNIIIDDAYEEQKIGEEEIDDDVMQNFYTLKDKRIFRRPIKHPFAFKWVNSKKNEDTLFQIKQTYQKLKIADIIYFVLSFFTFTLLIIDNELIFKESKGLKILEPIKIAPVNNTLRGISLAFTIPLLVVIVLRSQFYFKWRKLNGYEKINTKFRKSTTFRTLLFELFLHLLISPPGYETKQCYWVMARKICNPLSDLFMLFSILRLYQAVRVFTYFSKWSNEHSSLIRDLYGVSLGSIFVFKCLFKKRPFIFLFTFILLIAIVSAFSIRIFERAYYATYPVIDKHSDDYQDFENFWNVLWLSCVTITTVGFGDFYCKSHFGRFTSCIACMLGVFTISLMLVSLERTTKLNQIQAVSYEVLFRLNSRDKLKDLSASLVTFMMKLNLKKRRIAQYQQDKTLNLLEIKKLQQEIARIRNQIKTKKAQFCNVKQNLTKDYEWPVEEILRQLKNKMEKDVEEIQNQVQIMNDTMKVLMNIKSYQQILSNQMDIGIKNTKKIFNRLLTNEGGGKAYQEMYKADIKIEPLSSPGKNATNNVRERNVKRLTVDTQNLTAQDILRVINEDSLKTSTEERDSFDSSQDKPSRMGRIQSDIRSSDIPTPYLRMYQRELEKQQPSSAAKTDAQDMQQKKKGKKKRRGKKRTQKQKTQDEGGLEQQQQQENRRDPSNHKSNTNNMNAPNI